MKVGTGSRINKGEGAAARADTHPGGTAVRWWLGKEARAVGARGVERAGLGAEIVVPDDLCLCAYEPGCMEKRKDK